MVFMFSEKEAEAIDRMMDDLASKNAEELASDMRLLLRCFKLLSEALAIQDKRICDLDASLTRRLSQQDGVIDLILKNQLKLDTDLMYAKEHIKSMMEAGVFIKPTEGWVDKLIKHLEAQKKEEKKSEAFGSRRRF